MKRLSNTPGRKRRLPYCNGFRKNGIVLRSLTKFHALPGVRIGYLAASAELAEAVRADLPAWNVNVFALSAAVAALGDTSDFAERARAENAERRADLAGDARKKESRAGPPFFFRIFCKVCLTNYAKRAMLILQS